MNDITARVTLIARFREPAISLSQVFSEEQIGISNEGIGLVSSKLGTVERTISGRHSARHHEQPG